MNEATDGRFLQIGKEWLNVDHIVSVRFTEDGCQMTLTGSVKEFKQMDAKRVEAFLRQNFARFKVPT